ncbi:unnamed protein product [Musa textilis]
MEVGLEKGFQTAIGEFILMQLQLASVFFTFQLGTKAHYCGRPILRGRAKYRTTGHSHWVTLLHEYSHNSETRSSPGGKRLDDQDSVDLHAAIGSAEAFLARIGRLATKKVVERERVSRWKGEAREGHTFASMVAENKFFESYKKAVTTAASVAASMMLVRTVVNEVIPYELRDYVFSRFDVLRSRLSSQHTIVIDQAEGYASNLVFDAARTYLSTRINRSMRSLRVSMVEEGKSMVVSLEPGEEMIDVYQGIEFKWQLISQQVERSSIHTNSRFSGSATESRSFVVSFHQKHKDKILHSYLPFILEQAKAIREQDRTLQLHMNEGGRVVPRKPPPPFHVRHIGDGPQAQGGGDGGSREIREAEGLLQ